MLSLGLDSDLSWRRKTPAEKRQITLADFPATLLNPPTAAGVVVTESTALTLSAYFDGVNVISSQVASLPRPLYRKMATGERERIYGHPTAKLMEQPNPAMTDFVFWQTLMGHALTWGNGYAEIEFDKALRPIALWPVLPNLISPAIVDGALVYKTSNGQGAVPSSDVFHIPGLGFDGLKGYSVVSMARQSLGLGLAAERFGGNLFGRGAFPGVVLESPKTLTPDAAARLKAGWDEMFKRDGAHGTAILEDGLKANKLGIPPEDAQFLQTREFQVLEIARWLNIPPHKLKHMVAERPGGNFEASQIEFLTDTLRPWLIRIEQEIKRKLLTDPALYVEHLADAILRMDGKARAESYQIYFDMGVLDAETIAEKENLPKPKPKPPEPAPVAAAPAPPAGNPPPPATRMLAADRANLVEVAGRFVRREASALRRASKKDSDGFGAWLAEFYGDEAAMLRGMLLPAVRLSMACRGLDGDPEWISTRLAAAYIDRSRDEVLDLPRKDLAAAAERLARQWEGTRAVELADQVLALQPTNGGL